MWCPDCNCVEHKVFRAVLPSGFDGIEHTTYHCPLLCVAWYKLQVDEEIVWAHLTRSNYSGTIRNLMAASGALISEILLVICLLCKFLDALICIQKDLEEHWWLIWWCLL